MEQLDLSISVLDHPTAVGNPYHLVLKSATCLLTHHDLPTLVYHKYQLIMHKISQCNAKLILLPQPNYYLLRPTHSTRIHINEQFYMYDSVAYIILRNRINYLIIEQSHRRQIVSIPILGSEIHHIGRKYQKIITDTTISRHHMDIQITNELVEITNCSDSGVFYQQCNAIVRDETVIRMNQSFYISIKYISKEMEKPSEGNEISTDSNFVCSEDINDEGILSNQMIVRSMTVKPSRIAW